MTLEPGWMKRQMEYAAEKTRQWPDWMKEEAGIHKNDRQAVIQNAPVEQPALASTTSQDDQPQTPR